MNKKLILITLVIIVVILTGYLLLNARFNSSSDISTANQPSLGNPDAKVKVVAFEDLKCPACAQYHNTIYPDIKDKYIDTDLIEYTDIILAFLPGSPIVGTSAYCVEEQASEQFYPYISAIFQADFGHNPSAPNREDLLNLASHVGGINIAELRECINSQRMMSRLEANMDIAQMALNNRVSTPSIFVNGKHVDSDNVLAAIESALQ